MALRARSKPVVSTVASKRLRHILVEERHRSSSLARKTVEYQLAKHQKYVSAPRQVPAGLPTLVDLAAFKIPEALLSLDDIPDPIVSRFIWGWHRISYAELRYALNRLADTGTTPLKKHQRPPSIEQKGDIDEWILIHEKYLADDERLGDHWQGGLITLDDARDVFPTSVLSREHRKIARPSDLPGYKFLDKLRAATVEIQPSLPAFRDSFERISDGLLKNLNWDNVLVAGGIVLGTLMAVDAAAGAPWRSSDIDVYIHGLGPNEANAKIQHIFSTFQANLPPNTPTFVVRNSKTITFYASYPLRRIQVVLKLVKSPRAVLLNFDLDVCAMGWDGSDVWMLPRAARALETGYIVFTMNLIQGHYLSERRATQEQRVFKYAYKGYGIRILPSYVSSLSHSQTKINQISPSEQLFDLNMDEIRESSRSRTQNTVARSDPGEKKFRHCDLDSKYQVSSEPQGRSCLSSFSLFMRHVELWDMEQRGEVSIEPDEWANTTYEDSVSDVLAYDDTPRCVREGYVDDLTLNLYYATQLQMGPLGSLNRIALTIPKRKFASTAALTSQLSSPRDQGRKRLAHPQLIVFRHRCSKTKDMSFYFFLLLNPPRRGNF
ncbi:hypothetical protein R3P38DRAFT_2552529 [Favolaschia claudopus]|uniref:Uncharacterized protein n=1 Tax=Favolaschia claudopus TaxID=2862362 RepID=A0AAW0AEX6_9AGAR